MNTSDKVGPVAAILLASLGTSIANVALPQIVSGLDARFATVQWVVIGYLLSLTVLSTLAGRLGDRIGHRRALRYGIALFTLGALGSAMAPQVWVLVAARMLQGAGAAAMIVLPMALLRDGATPDRLGRLMGMLGSASALGTALGPALGGFLIAGFDWRAVFWLLAGLGGICLVLQPAAGVRVRTDAAQADLAGAVMLAMVIAGLALAATLQSAAMLLVAVVGASAFLRREREVAQPFFPPAALADPALRRGLLANTLVAAVMMTTLVVGPFYLARGLGLGASSVGLVLAVGPVLSAISGVPAGRLVDRLGATPVGQLGVAMMAAAATLIAGLAPLLGLPAYLGGIAILTPGYQLFLAANTTQVMIGAAAAQRGLISGLLGLSRNLGLICGAAAMAALFARATGQAEVGLAGPVQIGSGLSVTFAVAAILLVAALALIRPVQR